MIQRQYNISYEVSYVLGKDDRLESIELISTSGTHTRLTRDKILGILFNEEEKEKMKKLMLVIALASRHEWKKFYETMKADKEMFPVIHALWQETLEELKTE